MTTDGAGTPQAVPGVAATLSRGGSVAMSYDPGMPDLARLSRMSTHSTVQRYTTRPPVKPVKRHPVHKALLAYSQWAVPGLGMFTAAYIIFSTGLIRPFQEAIFPTCFKTYETCSADEARVMTFAQLGALIFGMVLFGALGDVIGRRLGSRIVSAIMLLGCSLLVFTPLLTAGRAYLQFFVAAQVVYGFGVGGEYPMASSSAAERSQGMGNLVNSCVLIILMAMLGQTGSDLDPGASRGILIAQFAVAVAVAVFMTAWRFIRLQESQVWKVEREDAADITAADHRQARHIYSTAFWWFGPRLLATSASWAASNFAL